MASIKLLKTHTLTITREGDAVDKGYYDESGQWINPTTSIQFTSIGSLQPYAANNKSFVLPEGTKTSDTKIFYTTDDLRTAEQYDNLPADKTELNGLVYTCFAEADWEGYGLCPDHRAYVFLRDNPR